MNKTFQLIPCVVFAVSLTGVSQSISTATPDSANSIHTKTLVASNNSSQPVAAFKPQDVKSTSPLGLDTASQATEERTAKSGVKTRLASIKERGRGASGGPAYGFSAINMRPVKNLLSLYPALAGERFDFNRRHQYEMVIVSGGYGYVAIDKGMHIGGGGVHGKLRRDASYMNDSVSTLTVETSFGGFLFERTGSQNKWNYTAGGLLGGGNIQASVCRQISKTALTDFERRNMLQKKADFFLMEAHGGLSYSFFPLFHLGLNVSVPVFISPEGFFDKPGDGFVTLNPMVVFKVMIGTLG